MLFVFIDESGDYGFKNKKGTSKFFIIGSVVLDPPLVYDIRRIIKKARRKIHKKAIIKTHEIKASNSSDKIKNFVFNKLVNYNIRLYFLIIDKAKISNNSALKRKPDIFLYNYGFRFLLEKIIEDFGLEERYIFKFDGKRRGIKEYINRLIENDNLPKIKYKIEEIDSISETSICSIDFPVWAIKRKYEDNDLKYYEIIKSKIMYEKIFPK